ncbi:MAG: sugar ABC transporter permease [Vallitalea sp.]|nr:sugar ABC transporter permease [Vallitalea sp.]
MKKNRYKKKQNISDLVFMTPGLLIYLIFMIIPIILTFYYSFTNWNGINATYKFVGFKNFSYLLSDRSFIEAVKTTLIITVFTAFFLNVLAIIMAVILDGVGRVFKIGKVGIFIPAILSSVVVSFLWSYMTQTNGGIISYILSMFNIPAFDFYKTTSRTTYLVAGVITWAALGFYTTVYDATLKTIPDELYEASRVDGANALQKFFRITLPLLTPGITINSIMAVTWGLKQYDFVKIMTPGSIQTIAVNAVERAFDYNRFAYASAIVLVLFLAMVLISFLQIYVTKKVEVEY